MDKRQIEAAREKYEQARRELLKAVAESKMKMLVNGIENSIGIYETLDGMSDKDVKKISKAIPSIIVTYMKSDGCRSIIKAKENDKDQSQRAKKGSSEADKNIESKAENSEEKSAEKTETEQAAEEEKKGEEKMAETVEQDATEKQNVAAGYAARQQQSSGYNQNGIFQRRKW